MPNARFKALREELLSRTGGGAKYGLERMHAALDALGHPERELDVVHVAGTNGKGSVCAMVTAIAGAGGLRTGTFTSPHLCELAERIRLDGEPIDRERFADALEPVLHRSMPAVTFFEAMTLAGMVAMKRANVDLAILEVGLGGRLDATNVVSPELTIITNVSDDHLSMLGGSIEAAAREKAGIMKPGVPCVTGAAGRPLAVLKEVSQERRVPMSILGDDYHALPDVNGFRLLRPDGEAHHELALAGRHQIDNAALVVAAMDALRARGHHVPVGAVHEALAHARMPGRMDRRVIERDGRRIEVLIDGAHNLAGAVALRQHLADLDWAGFALICGFQGDKAWSDLLQQWAPLASHGYGVPLRSPRTLDPAAMAPVFDIIPFTACRDVADAMERALDQGAERIVCAGSLWLAGEALAVLDGVPLEELRGIQ